jgi:hypothetical protein
MVQVESLPLLTCRRYKDMVFGCVLRSWRKLEQIDEEILRENFAHKKGATSKEASD